MAKTVKNKVIARSSKKQPNFKAKSRFSPKQLLIFATLFGVIIGVAAWHSFAATPSLLILEAEDMNVDNGGIVNAVSDPTASGGKAMMMVGNHTSISQTFTETSKIGAYELRVHALNCYGSDSLMSVKADGRYITGTAESPWVKVTGTDWAKQTFTIPVSTSLQSTHTLTVYHQILPHIDSPCNNWLYVDYVAVDGPKIVPAQNQ